MENKTDVKILFEAENGSITKIHFKGRGVCLIAALHCLVEEVAKEINMPPAKLAQMIWDNLADNEIITEEGDTKCN